MAGRVHTEIEESIGWIVFDHPERRNALSPNMWSELAAAAEVLGADEAVRVVVMRGAGDVAFVSGADISSFDAAAGGATAGEIAAGGGNAFAALDALDKPLIAMVHGFCIGGGLAVALLADMRYCADDGVFGIPAARLGVGYDIGGIEILSELVGLSAAKEILFSARRYDAAEAHAMGLVNRVWPKASLEDEVRALARQIGANAPLSVRSVKVATRELRRERGARDLAAVREATAACFESEDFSEGVRAFMEKRRPEFKGR